VCHRSDSQKPVIGFTCAQLHKQAKDRKTCKICKKSPLESPEKIHKKSVKAKISGI
jgi:hypothetical protein